MQKIIKT